MIGFVQGTVHGVFERSCIVLTSGGVGYEVFPTETVLASLTPGAVVSFHIVTTVRDDAILLHGFPTADEKRLFQLLTTVNQVGPRIALSILGAGSVPQIIGAIISGNVAFFKGVSGVGKKTAEKIIIDMRDKVKDLAAEAEGTTPSPTDPKAREAEMGLIALGYHPNLVRTILSRIEDKEKKRPEEIVREALALIREQVRR